MQRKDLEALNRKAKLIGDDTVIGVELAMAIVGQNYHIMMKECKLPSQDQKYDIYSVEPQSQTDLV